MNGIALRACLALTLIVSTTVLPCETRAEDIVIANAQIKLLKECDLPARDAGQIVLLNVKEGDLVKEGQVLGHLENKQQELAVKQADYRSRIAKLIAGSMLSLKTAAAKLDEAEAAKEAREVDLQIARQKATSDAAVGIARAELNLRQLELERASKAKETFDRSVSGSQLGRLKTDLERWKQELSQAENDQQIRQLQPQAEMAAIQQASETIERSKLAVDLEQQNLKVSGFNQQIEANAAQQAAWNLELRNLRSPMDGIVASVDQKPGEWVEKGATVVRIINLDRLRVEGLLAAKYASQKLLGAKAMMTLNGSPVVGRVVYVGREIDPVDQVVKVHVEIENPEGEILPGTICNMTLRNPDES